MDRISYIALNPGLIYVRRRVKTAQQPTQHVQLDV